MTRHDEDVTPATFRAIPYGYHVLEERGVIHRAVGDVVVLWEADIVGPPPLRSQRTGSWKLAEVTDSDDDDVILVRVVASGRGPENLLDVLGPDAESPVACDTPEGPMVHELKTWPEPFQDVWDGMKTYEVRRDDRGFGICDELILREWVPELDADGTQVLGTDGAPVGHYTGAEIRATVVHKLPGGSFGLPLGMCVLGIDVTLRRDSSEEAVDAMLADLPEEPEAQP